MKKPLGSCSGHKLEIKTVLQRLSAPPVAESSPKDLKLFLARVRGNGRFLVPVRADGARVFK